MEKKFKKAYSENQRPEGSRDELNAWHDYSYARNAGKTHEAAMQHAAAEADKFSSTKGMATPKAEIDRLRRQAESRQRSRTGHESK